MSPDSDPAIEGVTVSSPAIAAIAVEVWRVRQAIGQQEHLGKGIPGVAALRFAVRSLERVLADIGIETVDFRGHAYEPGMCVQVEQVTEPPGGAGELAAEVAETLEPTVLLKGAVILPGRVVVASAVREEPPNA